MKYLFDTNACIRYINGRAPNLRERIRTVSDTDIVISAVTKYEMTYGAARSEYPERSREKHAAFFSRFISLPFDDAAAEICGNIRAQLANAGTPIGPYDLQIAAIALVHNLIVVTHNTVEFGRVPGLQMEDWEV